YIAALASYKVKESQTGNPTVAAVFEIQEGDYTGRKIWTNFSLLPQSAWVIKAFMEAHGDKIEGDSVIFDPDDYLQRDVAITVVNAIQKGTDIIRNSIEKFSPVPKKKRQ
ncbi:unnamed protein product, partial [marine sediment metagenome]